jgi:PAS domain S-box-containing protein
VFSGDADATNTARLLNSLLIGFAFAVALIALALPPSLGGLALCALGLVPVALAWVILRRGHVRTASALLVVGTFALIVWTALTDGGVRAAAFTPLIVVVVLAGLLLGRRGAIIAAGASITAGICLVLAERAHVLVEPVHTSSASYLVVYSIALVLTAGILGLALDATRKAVERVRESEHILAEKNAALERHTAELVANEAALNRALRAYRLLSGCNRAVARSGSELELTRNFCEVIASDPASPLASISLGTADDPGSLRQVASSGAMASVLDTDTSWDASCAGDDPSALAWSSGEIARVDSIAAASRGERWHVSAVSAGFGSAIAIPLCSDTERLGVLAIYSRTPDSFDADEIVLLQRLANDLVYGLVTQRANAEARLKDISVSQNEERLRQATLVSQLGIFDHDHVANSIYWSPELRANYGWGADDERHINELIEHIHPDDRESFITATRRSHDPQGDGLFDSEIRVIRSSGEVRWTATRSKTFFDGDGAARRPVRTVGAVLDITDRKLAAERIERQLQRLAALRTIDMAISGSLNLKLTLGVIVQQIMGSLDADAVSVLTLDPHTFALNYAHGDGFRSTEIGATHVPLGEGPAGRAALGQQTLQVAPPSAKNSCPLRSELFAREGMRSHIATPLIVKGQTKGVLEVFHRSTFEPDDDWTTFLEALALQTAIAMDSAAMFENLERTNMELSLAYDATIEGWSRALDLRDRETEGHTQRVTTITMRLAHAMGINGPEAVHIRRGALLHDIGKMGVPDSILHKPGKLTDDEWAMMRQHPQLAFEMLAPIAHLRPALDIPSCHHERWDGTGYPRGLKGELIPFAARIFAVVDVWDALCSDRPYRAAWPAAEAREYIRARSGTHFDPTVGDAFMTLLENV